MKGLQLVRMPWSPRDRGPSTSERDADAEIARNLWRNYYLLPPTSPMRYAWDWGLVLLVVFNSLEIPFVLSFNLPSDARTHVKNFDVFVDVVFWLDIIANCNTSYFVDEQLVHSRKDIIKRYALSWLSVDVVATFPWDALSSGLKPLRLIRMLRLKRVVLMLDSLKGGITLRFFQLLFWWFLVTHWTACIWWSVGTLEFNNAVTRERDGNGNHTGTSWLVRIPPKGTEASGFDPGVFTQCVYSCMATCTNDCTRIMCMANTTCDDNNLDPDLSVRIPEEVWRQWLSSLYWALTMLMKMPNVSPDTTLEKFIASMSVIVGAIFFALLLGQVTTIIMVTAKAGAQLRDQLVTMATFAASRRMPARMHNMLKKHISTEWLVTKGMDTQALLHELPVQLKGDVLVAVFAPLLECNPPFLRCSEQLRRQMLSLLRPAVALKKQTIVAGHQFGATMYVLMKGTLQVSQAPAQSTGPKDESGSPGKGNMARRAASMGAKDLRKELTRANTKGFKDKLKVRMLEKPGAVIPLDNIFEGARVSPFSVFAVTQCQMLTIEANELARMLEAYPSADASIVTKALEADYKGLIESLKMNRPSAESSRESHADAAGPSAAVPPKPASKDDQTLDEKITAMEKRAAAMTTQIDGMQALTSQLPLVLKALTSRLGMDVQAAPGSGPPTPKLAEPVSESPQPDYRCAAPRTLSIARRPSAAPSPALRRPLGTAALPQ